MARPAVIFGNGGHARVIASIIWERYSAISFLTPEMEADFFNQIDSNSKTDIFIGIGDNQARARVFEKLAEHRIKPALCVSNHACIAKDVEIGPGAMISHGSVIMAGTKLGVNVIVNTLSSVDHDCVIGDHTQITAGVTLGGAVHTGKNCFFGIKSAVIPGIEIGDNTVVMAGSVVTKNATGNVVLGGYPAAVLRRTS